MTRKPDTFASRLKALRLAAGLSAYRLAQLASISKQSLSQIEAGKSKPSFDTVSKLCAALGKSLAEFDGVTPA